MEHQLAAVMCICSILYCTMLLYKRIQHLLLGNKVLGDFIGKLFHPMLFDADVFISDTKFVY